MCFVRPVTVADFNTEVDCSNRTQNDLAVSTCCCLSETVAGGGEKILKLKIFDGVDVSDSLRFTASQRGHSLEGSLFS